MQPNRPPAMPHFRQGLRRAVPMNTAPPRPGYDISILNAASARPNELIYQRFHRAPPARPPGPPVCITLDSDGEEVEPVAKKARQSPDEVICLDSDTDQADSDSDDVIVLDSDSDANLESDSDDVVADLELAEIYILVYFSAHKIAFSANVLVEVHHEISSPNASEISELGQAEQSESENKENQSADSSDSTPQRILRSQISKTSPSQPEVKESIYANKKIREGADYQTVMQPLLEDHEPPSVHYDKECEERIWSPRIFDVEHPEMEDLFIEETRVVYWKAIWRQFKGRILFEDALQHLMENDYDFAASLETIDRCLEKRPNLMRHPCMAQAARLVTHGLKETVSMRRLRKLAIPNEPEYIREEEFNPWVDG
ncbi:hypothetical protein CRE_04464 [Caenorhabditis remanei]|uniref:ELM2 domain-containing protein n=1 Tax=Caenorhabditis remanei TaxID=31234 RepID=E3NU66_CAERE|nr:hypothetical protein CRE_04464 [Caenorhabditis remanei]